MPRHVYGELARTLEGCALLSQRSVVADLLSIAHRRLSDSACGASGSSNAEMRSALWSLGHISSSELGLSAILGADPMFVEWCLENVASCPNFSLRGTFFYVVGLLSRTAKGNRKLLQSQWDSAPAGSNSAVAFPRNTSVLFRPLSSPTGPTGASSAPPGPGLHNDSDAHPQSVLGSPPKAVKSLTPFLQSGAVSIETEILNLIAKVTPQTAEFGSQSVALTR